MSAILNKIRNLFLVRDRLAVVFLNNNLLRLGFYKFDSSGRMAFSKTLAYEIPIDIADDSTISDQQKLIDFLLAKIKKNHELKLFLSEFQNAQICFLFPEEQIFCRSFDIDTSAKLGQFIKAKKEEQAIRLPYAENELDFLARVEGGVLYLNIFRKSYFEGLKNTLISIGFKARHGVVQSTAEFYMLLGGFPIPRMTIFNYDNDYVFLALKDKKIVFSFTRRNLDTVDAFLSEFKKIKNYVSEKFTKNTILTATLFLDKDCRLLGEKSLEAKLKKEEIVLEKTKSFLEYAAAHCLAKKKISYARLLFFFDAIVLSMLLLLYLLSLLHVITIDWSILSKIKGIIK